MSLSDPQRLYRSGDAESLHRYTLIPDHPDFARARLNALHLSDVSEPQFLGVCLFLSDYLCPNWMLFVNKKKKVLGSRTWNRRNTGEKEWGKLHVGF